MSWTLCAVPFRAERRSTSSRRSAPCHSCDDRSPQITESATPGSRCGQDFGSCGPRSLPRSPLTLVISGGLIPGRHRSAEATLRGLADTAGDQPGVVAPGSFVYTRSKARELQKRRGLGERFVMAIRGRCKPENPGWPRTDRVGFVTTVEDARFLHVRRRAGLGQHRLSEPDPTG